MRALATITALLIALGLAACGTETTDITQGEAEITKELKPAGGSFECPDEVEGGEGAKFECTAKGPGGDQVVPMTLDTEDGELAIGPQDQKQYESALTKALAP
ncbi:MAG: DUF4333 domain-containing protein [Thermoleophilaceae bacterium]|nr:DUF4333 domain-containing protein [Thermoleophilaceae bacterium]